MSFNEKIFEVQRLLEQVNSLLDKQRTSLDATSEAIERYAKNVKLPSDLSHAQRQINEEKKLRAELQKTMEANNAAMAKKKAQIQAMFLDAEAKRQKALAAEEAKTAKEIAMYEKATQKAIEANAKKLQAEEKRIAREIELEERKNAKIAAANERLARRQAQIDARNSRTGASSVIPGMGARIAELRESERIALANERLNRSYVQLTMRRNEARDRLQDLIASERASNREIRTAQREFDRLDDRVRRANAAVRQFSTSSGSLSSLSRGVGDLMGAFGVATGLYLGVSIIKNIYETTKQLQSMDLALKMVSGSQQEFAANQQFLLALAERYGIEIKGLTKNFTEFWVASKGKLEAEQIKAIFTSISKSVAVMGLSVEQQDAAFLALQQMMSKGTVQAEELKKQLGNALPGAIKAATIAYQNLHPELKVTEKLFMEQMKLGKVISSEFLPELAKAYEKIYGIENVTRATTLQAAQERLANSWAAMVRSMNNSETGGISKFFQVIIDGAAHALTKIVELNSSWKDMFTSAKTKGIEEGKDTFKYIFSDLYKPLTDEQKSVIKTKIAELNTIINSESQKGAAEARGKKQSLMDQLYYSDPENIRRDIRESAKIRLDALREEERKIIADLKKYNENPYQFSLTTGKSGSDLASERLRITEEINAEAEIIRQSLAKTEAVRKTQASAVSAETEKQRKERLRKEKELADLLEELARNEFARKMSDLERELEMLRDSYDNKKNLGNDYVRIAFQIADKEQEIIQARYDEEMRLAAKNAKNKQDRANLEKIALNKKYTDEENAYKKHLETLDSIRYDNKNGVTDTGAVADPETYGPGVFILDPKRAEDMVKEFEKGQDAVRKTKEEIERAKNLLREFFQQTEGEFFSEAGFEKTYEMFFRLDEQGKTMFENLRDAAKTSAEQFAVTFNTLSESAQEAYNFIMEASNANFDNEYANLERRRDIALLFAGESESARAEIEQQYEQKRRDIRKREWQAQKQQALFNIAIDTAQAVVASVAKSPLTFGLPFSAFALAIGAAQAAIVSAQKMPQFWKGTDNAPEGWAWTQEQGREVILDKHGNLKSVGTDKGPTATYLNQGDKVLNHKESMEYLSFDKGLNKMLSESGIQLSPQINKLDTSKLEAKIDGLKEAIAKKPSLKIVKDDKGYNVFERTQAETKKYLNGRLTYEQYDV